MVQISLKAVRVNAGLTVVKAADIFGISPTTLIKWEKYPGDLTPNQQKKISEVYNFPVDNIFFGSEVELNSIKTI